jgi:hypothetical protein
MGLYPLRLKRLRECLARTRVRCGAFANGWVPSLLPLNRAQWWALLVGALRVHPHKHYANYPPQKDRGLPPAGRIHGPALRSTDHPRERQLGAVRWLHFVIIEPEVKNRPLRPSTDSPQLTAARRFDNPGDRLDDDIWVIRLNEVANIWYEAPDADAGQRRKLLVTF